jgi:hypothetical protein
VRGRQLKTRQKSPRGLGASTVRRTTGSGCHSEVRSGATPGPGDVRPPPCWPNRDPQGRVRGFHRPARAPTEFDACPGANSGLDWQNHDSNGRLIPSQLVATAGISIGRFGQRDNGEAASVEWWDAGGIRAEEVRTTHGQRCGGGTAFCARSRTAQPPPPNDPTRGAWPREMEGCSRLRVAPRRFNDGQGRIRQQQRMPHNAQDRWPAVKRSSPTMGMEVSNILLHSN